VNAAETKRPYVWDFHPILENSGVTPAENVITQYFANRLDGDETPPFKDSADANPTPTSIGPKATQLVSE
jgi:hypothetical protein